MKAIVRLLLLFFTALPVQRVLIGVGVVLALAGTLASSALSAPIAVASVLAGLGGLLAVVPLFFLLGPLFRLLSTPRLHGLIPGFRRRLLQATAMIIILLSAATAVFATADAQQALKAFVFMAAILSAVLWFCYFVTAGALGLALIVCFALVAGNMLFALPTPDIGDSAMVGIVAVVLIVGWTVASRRYLRGGAGRASPAESGEAAGAPRVSILAGRTPEPVLVTSPPFNTLGRLLLLFCAGIPLQRYVLLAGAVMIPVGIALAGFAPREGILLMTLGSSMVVLAAVVPAGWIFRQMSMPGAHRFVPGFRVTMLGALLVFVSLPPVLAASLVVITGAPVSAFAVATYTALQTSVLVWLLFYFPASVWAAIPVLIGTGIIANLPESQQAVIEQALGPVPVAVVLLAAWSAFAIWYLRAPRIGPFMVASPIPALSRWESRQFAVLDGPVAPDVATTVHLTRRTRPNARQWASLIVFAMVLGPIVSIALSHAPPPIVAGAVLVGMVGAYLAARQMTWQVRSLWLSTSMSRTGLYRAAERELLLTVLPTMAALLAVLLASFHIVIGLPADFLAALLICAITTAWFAITAGLMRTKGFGVIDTIASAALVLSLVTIIRLTADVDSSSAQLVIVSAMQAGAALLCRSLGLHRWRNVDWSALRPSLRERRDPVAGLVAGLRN